MTIYQGDNTQAFGGHLVKVSLKNDTEQTITRAKFSCGDVVRDIKDPVFPLFLDFDEVETKKLKLQNTCYLAVWDSENRKATVRGHLHVNTQKEVVPDE
jgi:hypothetical protein